MSGARRILYGWLTALSLMLVAGAAIFFLVRAGRNAAWQKTRANSLKQVGIALHNFHDSYRHFPTAVHRDEAGKALSSWRFRILPYVEAIMRDWDYEEPWDDPANEWLTQHPHLVYCLSRNPESLHTNIVAIVGPGTAFDDDRPCSLKDIDSDTILAIEVADSSIPWAAPGDLPIGDVTVSILHGLDGGGLNVLFADGAVWYIRKSADFNDLRAFFSVEGAKNADRELLLRPYANSGGN